MSFIIACIMIFIIASVKFNDSVNTTYRKKELESEWSNYEEWEKRNTDKELEWRLRDFIDDESNYNEVQKEMREFLKVIPGWDEYLKTGFPIYPRQFSGSEKQRISQSNQHKSYVLLVMMANRGKVYNPIKGSCDCGMLKKLVFIEPKARIDRNLYVLRYKWYEETLIRGGMSKEDAIIYYVPYRKWDHKLNKMVVMNDEHPVSERAKFNFAHNMSKEDREIAQRLW